MLSPLVVLSVANVVLSAGLLILPIGYLGATAEVDVFVAAMMVPNVVTAIGAVVITYVLVPPLATAAPEIRRSLLRRAYAATGWYLCLPVAALWSAASAWVPHASPGFGAAQVEATVALSRLTLPAAVVGLFAMIHSADYQARMAFLGNMAIATGAAALGLGVGAALIGRIGVWAVAVGLLARAGGQLAMLLAFRARGGETGPAGRSPSLEKRAVPILLSASLSKTEPLIDRGLLSSAPVGSLATYTLTQQIYGACSQVLASSVLAHVLPKLSTMTRSGERKRLVARESWRIAVLSVATTLLLVAGVQIVQAGPLRALVGQKVDLQALTVQLFALFGMWAFGLHGQLVSGYFYSKGDTSTPSWIGAVGFAAAVPLKVFAFRSFGMVGLGVATSLYLAANALAMSLVIWREEDRESGNPVRSP